MQDSLEILFSFVVLFVNCGEGSVRGCSIVAFIGIKVRDDDFSLGRGIVQKAVLVLVDRVSS